MAAEGLQLAASAAAAVAACQCACASASAFHQHPAPLRARVSGRLRGAIPGVLRGLGEDPPGLRLTVLGALGHMVVTINN